MAPGLLGRLRSWFQPTADEDYEVEEYALSRREPDPEHRIRTYEQPVTAGDVGSQKNLPPGIYLLQEVKASGLAGRVLWEEAIGDTDLEP